ncbi:MAG TPA: c-type cytochrome [Stellaceae bacterium]|jgi:cytochrome c2|nr:c-type cytochrome [Stellaceae bacterium]
MTLKHGVMKMAAILATATLAFGSGIGAARAADGADVFNNNCAVCHSTDPGTNKLGPSLAGVVGRKSGSLGDYSYSPAMAKLGATWDNATLDKYLTDPQTMVPGTKMIFPGVKDANDRKALIDYLATLQG